MMVIQMPRRGMRMRVEAGSKRAKYCRLRIADPEGFDPRSLRIKTVKRGVKIIVGCPKGMYSALLRRCRVGTKPQSLLKRKTKKGACPTFKTSLGKVK